MPKRVVSAGKGNAKKEPLPADIQTVERLTAGGCSQIEISRQLGISRDTFQRWRRDHKEVAEALEAGLAAEHKALRSVLLEKALAGDTVCILFALKTRHGYRESAPIVEESRVNIQISLPGALSTEQYGKVIEHEKT